jgi:hypothetical protein
MLSLNPVAESKEWDRMPELTITSPYVNSRVDSNTFTKGNPMPESTLTQCQSRLCPPVKDFGWIWPVDFGTASVRHLHHSAISYPELGYISSTSRLLLIQKLGYISSTSRLLFIHKLVYISSIPVAVRTESE